MELEMEVNMELEMEMNMEVEMEHNWLQGNKLMVSGMDELLIYLLIYLLCYLFAHLSIGGMSCSCN